MMIKLNNIQKQFQNGDERLMVLDELSLDIKEEKLISIIGASGSGKSTFLKILGMLDRNFKGQYILDGIDTKGLTDNELSKIRGQNIGFVFQDFQLIEHLTVYENLELALIAIGQYDKKVNKEKIISILKKVELEEKMGILCNRLSGGQKQRVSIARALVKNPKIILADEPTGSLDELNTKSIMNLLKGLANEGQTIIIITHDLSIAKQTERQLILQQKRLSNA